MLRLHLAVISIASAVALGSRIASAQDLPTLGPLEDNGVVTYFIAAGKDGTQYRDGDRDLAAWALGDWQRAARGVLRFEPGDEQTALVRVYWVEAGGGQYGEMIPIEVDGRRGAAVFIRPDTEALGPEIAALARGDPLFRDTIVYLTCVHELGHALGLRHTADFLDVMYFFGYGGDIPKFFGRYREQLDTRAGIAQVSGLSLGDVAQLSALYPRDSGDERARPGLRVLGPEAPAGRSAELRVLLEGNHAMRNVLSASLAEEAPATVAKPR